MIIVTSSCSKSFVFKMFFVHTEKLRFRDGLVGTVSLTVEEKAAFSNSSGLKGVYEKLRFRDGLVGTVSLTVEIKLRFQISPPYINCGPGRPLFLNPQPSYRNICGQKQLP